MDTAPTPDIVHGTAMDYLRHARVSRWALTTYLARRFEPAAAKPGHAMRQAIEKKLEAMCENGHARKIESTRGAVCYVPVAGQPFKLPQLEPNAQDYKALDEKYRECLRENNLLRERLDQARLNNEKLHALANKLLTRIQTNDPLVPRAAHAENRTRAEINCLSISENVEQTP